MRFIALLLLLFVPCCPLAAQIKLQPEYASGQPVIVEVSFPDAPEGAVVTDVLWTVSGEAGYKPLSQTSIAIWPRFGLKDSLLRLHCSGLLTSADGKYIAGSHREFDAQTKLLGISDDPGPGPGPTPDPDPTPDTPAPIPEPGFRILIVYESKDLLSLPGWVHSAEWRNFTMSACVKGKDGKTPEYRITDQDSPVVQNSQLWADALKRKRDSLPWILISNGKTGYEGPLPATLAETLDLAKKYGGK